MIVGSLLLILVAAALIVAGLALASNWLLGAAIFACVAAAALVYMGSRRPAAQSTPARAKAQAPAPAGARVPVAGGDRMPGVSVINGLSNDLDAAPHGFEDIDTEVRASFDDASSDLATRGAIKTSSSARPSTTPAGHLGGATFRGPGNAAVGGPSARGDDDEGDFTDSDLEDVDDVDLEFGDPSDEPPPQIVTPIMQSRLARLTLEVLVVDGRPRYHLAGCVHVMDRVTEGLPVAEAQALGFTPCAMCEPATILAAP